MKRLLTKAVQGKTPIEAWSGRKTIAKHLRVFGSVCYAHIPSQKRSKLDVKAEGGIFLGYDSQAKGYRLFNLSDEKIMISRDVEFDEDASWNWEEEKVEKKFFLAGSEVHDEPRDENTEEAPSIPIQAGNGTGETSDDDNATGPRGGGGSPEVVGVDSDFLDDLEYVLEVGEEAILHDTPTSPNHGQTVASPAHSSPMMSSATDTATTSSDGASTASATDSDSHEVAAPPTTDSSSSLCWTIVNV
uniref:Retroviral polymerase SH3-like domain-containing protein n=1 Tax=Chenopodium quinoa TaxID=63459 RepID=A0A803N1K3_CHEQI